MSLDFNLHGNLVFQLSFSNGFPRLQIRMRFIIIFEYLCGVGVLWSIFIMLHNPNIEFWMKHSSQHGWA